MCPLPPTSFPCLQPPCSLTHFHSYPTAVRWNFLKHGCCDLGGRRGKPCLEHRSRELQLLLGPSGHSAAAAWLLWAQLSWLTPSHNWPPRRGSGSPPPGCFLSLLCPRLAVEKGLFRRRICRAVFQFLFLPAWVAQGLCRWSFPVAQSVPGTHEAL